MGLFDLYTYYTSCYISKWCNYFKVYWSGHLILTTFFSLFWLYDAYNFTIHRNVDFDNCRQSDNVLLSQSRGIKLLEYNSIFLIDLSILLYMITCAQLIFCCCFFSENMYMYYFINMVIKKYPSLFFINYWEMAYSADDQGLMHFFLVKIFTNPWVKRLQDWTCTLIMAHC